MKKQQQVTLATQHFDLAKTLECGQCFRWKRNLDGSYTGVVNNRVISATQQDNILLLYPVTVEESEKLWRPYFDLDRDYAALGKKILSEAPWMERAVSLGRGIRILAQDPWETTISFVLSANNHIPRVTASIDCLSSHYGTFLKKVDGKAHYAFPTPGSLKEVGEEGWKNCGAGYRWPYLAATVAQWEACLQSLENLASESAHDPMMYRQVLEKLPGVGPKVSACISLYGLGQHRQFPVDVWIRRRVKELWAQAPAADRDIESAARILFGDAAGYAQQLLFYQARIEKVSKRKHSLAL